MFIDEIDMRISKDLTDSFKERMKQCHNDMDINFSVMVLGTNFWPLNPPRDCLIVPNDIQLTYERFQKYYQQKHSGRKLTWLWNYCRHELRTNYLSQKYVLITSAYQIAVLLQYNNNDTLSLDELATATNVRKDILAQVLQPLVKSRILLDGNTNVYNLNPRAFYSLIARYTTFSSRVKRFQIKEDSCKPVPAN
jgi:cullin 1